MLIIKRRASSALLPPPVFTCSLKIHVRNTVLFMGFYACTNTHSKVLAFNGRPTETSTRKEKERERIRKGWKGPRTKTVNGGRLDGRTSIINTC